MKLPERFPLANLPTPIHFLPRISRELGKDLYLWRDDLTGFADSGNKLRKLEYLAAEAIRQKATVLISCGGPQSNHARATAFVARRLGMKVTLILRAPENGLDPAQKKTGNYLLNQILDAEIRLLPYQDYKAAGSKYESFLAEEASRLRALGEIPFIVPEGGSTALGAFGYYHAIKEMKETWARAVPGSQAPDNLFAALGSGGTYAGLHLGLEKEGLGSKRLFAVNVCDDAAYFEKRIHGMFDEMEANYGIKAQERSLQILDGHVGEGYAKATESELRFYAQVARKEGVLLDPVYTGKAFLGMCEEIKKSPSRFGKEILFLHSGGGFATFAYADAYLKALSS